MIRSHHPRLARALTLLAALTLVPGTAGGCSSAAPSATARFAGSHDPAPLPATEPYLVMTGPSTGWAVWPSGTAWLLLQTTDSFAHVTNRTPLGVETDGGLVASTQDRRFVVAVVAHELLLRSPILAATGTGAWTPTELTGAVSVARGGLSATSRRVTAVTTTGTVLAQTATGWQTLTTAATLAPGTHLHLDSVTWASTTTGWVTGHGHAGAPMAFQTTNAGTTWTPITAASRSTVAALAPCGNGDAWLLPVIDSAGRVTVLRTTDTGQSWTPGAPLRLPTADPAWGCAGAQVWMAGRVGDGTHLFSSTDTGQTWTDRGPAPPKLTDLSPTGAGVGFAATGGEHPTLWKVTSDGTHFTKITLPTWVATLGTQPGGS